MAFRRRSGASWVTPSTLRRRSGSSWADIQTIRRRSGSSWVTVYTAYTPISVSAPHVYGQSGFGQTSVTAGTTAHVTGGSGTITYAWTHISGPATLTGTSNGASASFYYSVPRGSGSAYSVYRITVSDGKSSAFQVVHVELIVGEPL